jgi:5-hydroxyisourate hydrolase
MKRISTHILDVHRGQPATGVTVRLEFKEADGTWRALNSTHTDQDGRCPQLLPTHEMPGGVYRLVFDVASYFSALKLETLYPAIEITFRVRDGESHFHIPLLFSANGYTTYRGS